MTPDNSRHNRSKHTNLCPGTDGHWTKCVSSSLSWHKVQDRVFPVEWALLADADPSSEAPLWGNAAAAVAPSAEVLDPRGSPPDLEARGRGCLAGDEAGLGLVWLTPPAMDEDEEGRPELLLALLPATAVWIWDCVLGWFCDELSSRSSSGVMKGAIPIPIPSCLRLISASTVPGKIMELLMGAVLAVRPAGMPASSPWGIPAILWVTRLGGMAAASIGLRLPLGLWRFTSWGGCPSRCNPFGGTRIADPVLSPLPPRSKRSLCGLPPSAAASPLPDVPCLLGEGPGDLTFPSCIPWVRFSCRALAIRNSIWFAPS